MKRFRKLLLLPLLIAGLLFQTQAFAADYSCTVTIPVEVQVMEDSVPSDVDFTITLTPNESGNPMPAASSITITDSEIGEFGPITYTKPGDYIYTVTQVKGSQKYFTYDTTSYTVTVRVVNDGEGGLTSETWAIEEDAGVKTDAILFTNAYDPPVAPTPTPTQKPTTRSTLTTIKHTTPKVSSPKTGDETNLIVLGCLTGISLLGLIGLTVVFYWSRKRN